MLLRLMSELMKFILIENDFELISSFVDLKYYFIGINHQTQI